MGTLILLFNIFSQIRTRFVIRQRSVICASGKSRIFPITTLLIVTKEVRLTIFTSVCSNSYPKQSTRHTRCRKPNRLASIYYQNSSFKGSSNIEIKVPLNYKISNIINFIVGCELKKLWGVFHKKNLQKFIILINSIKPGIYFQANSQ